MSAPYFSPRTQLHFILKSLLITVKVAIKRRQKEKNIHEVILVVLQLQRWSFTI